MTLAERTILTVGEDGRVTAIHLRPSHDTDHSRVLWGHKEIGMALGRSERWSWKHAWQMPLYYVDGRPCITLADLMGWLKAQQQRGPTTPGSTSTTTAREWIDPFQGVGQSQRVGEVREETLASTRPPHPTRVRR